jgi:O-succinylhomoserine sulfhydrylase
VGNAERSGSALNNTIFPGLESHPQFALASRQMTAGGTVIALDIKGGQGATFKFLNALNIILLSNNLGDAKSLVTHPATTTHQRLTPEMRADLGITDGLVRISVGLEDAGDLVDDILQALGEIT